MMPRAPRKTVNLSESQFDELARLKPDEITWGDFFLEGAKIYHQPKADSIALSPGDQSEVDAAVASGANLEELIRQGLVWSARNHNTRKRKIDVDLRNLTDIELELMPPEKAKLVPGLGNEKARRTIQRIKDWNETQSEKTRQIAISATYLFNLRKELGKLTGGKFSQVNRPSVNEVCPKSVSDDYNAYKGLEATHNRSIPAQSLGVQAFAELIKDSVDPAYEMIFQNHLDT